MKTLFQLHIENVLRNKKHRLHIEYSKIYQLDKCAICHEDLFDKLKMLRCGHEYHKQCIDNWTIRNNKCPICRKIVFFRDSLISQNSIDQFIGYRNALEHYKINFDNKFILISEKKNDKETYKLIEKLFVSKNTIDGLFTPNNFNNSSVSRFIEDYKKRITKKVKIICFDEINFLKNTHSEVHLIQLNGNKMGAKIFNTFLQEQTLLKNKVPLTFNTEILESTFLEK